MLDKRSLQVYSDKKVTEAWRVAQEKVDASENQVLNEENRCQDVRDAQTKLMEDFLQYKKDDNEYTPDKTCEDENYHDTSTKALMDPHNPS